MAWFSPSLGQLVTDLARRATIEMPGADAALTRNNLRPTVKIMAGGLFGLYGYMDWVSRQIFVRTADADMLDLHGAEMKPPVPRKLPAPAGGLVEIVADAVTGFAPGETIARSDGALYSFDEGGIVPALSATLLAVTAVTAGEGGNTSEGASLATSRAATITVAAGGLTGGADTETDEPYRRRLLFARAFPDHAGAIPDYVRYATSVAGCTRCFVHTGLEGRSTVTLYPLFDGTDTHGIPTEVQLARVRDVVAERQPGAARVTVRAAELLPIDVTVQGLLPLAQDLEALVRDEIAATFRRQSRVSGTMNPLASLPFVASPVLFQPGWIFEAVRQVVGDSLHTVPIPATAVEVPTGFIAVPGSITIA